MIKSQLLVLGGSVAVAFTPWQSAEMVILFDGQMSHDGAVASVMDTSLFLQSDYERYYQGKYVLKIASEMFYSEPLANGTCRIYNDFVGNLAWLDPWNAYADAFVEKDVQPRRVQNEIAAIVSSKFSDVSDDIRRYVMVFTDSIPDFGDIKDETYEDCSSSGVISSQIFADLMWTKRVGLGIIYYGDDVEQARARLAATGLSDWKVEYLGAGVEEQNSGQIFKDMSTKEWLATTTTTTAAPTFRECVQQCVYTSCDL